MIERVGLSGLLSVATFDGDLSDSDAALVMLRPNEVEELRIREARRWMELQDRRIEQREYKNLITNVGRALIASLGVGAGGTVYGYIAVNVGTPFTPAASDTVLYAETFRRACGTVAVLSTYYMRFVTNFLTSDWSGTAMGFGLFDASSNGNMGAIVSTSVAKTASQALVAEWRWQVTSA